jgi:subtilisin family serine protease
MSANAHVRVLSGLAAGLTVTALFATTFTVPANAAPIDTASKFQAGPSIDASRVVKGHYLVQTAGTPTVRGGNRTATKSALSTAKSDAAASGATVKGSFSTLWTGLSVTATDAQIKKLAKSPSVTAIFPVLKVALPKTQTSAADSSAALSEIGALNAGYTGDGIKVGVIDTGIDYNNVDLGGSGVNGNDASDFGSSAPRVRYGFDFVGDAYNADNAATSTAQSDPYPDDCAGHGTHVAGIIGASGSGDGDTVRGVAPKVTFGAYRIFGCDGSSATDIILAAMTQAQVDGMDVVNMSLGSDFASWPSYPENIAATTMTTAGVVLVAAAGNSGQTGLFSAGTPASGKGAISVASYESSTIRTKSIGVGTDKIAYVAIHDTTPAVDGTSLTLRNASDNTACKALTAVPANTAVLIKRGTCTISSKVQRAVTAGAAAVVLYDSEAGLNSYGTDPTAFAIPGVSISGTQGAALYTKIKKSGPQTMTWFGLESGISNPGGGRISTFSSAGVAADLSLVPTISGPGGKIYSTMPIEQGGHGTMSGTSMATPYVVGSVALLLEAKPALKGNPAAVAQLLYNTATPVTKSTESGVTSHPEAVFRQGSGLVQVANAIAAGVTASPSVLSLGEGTSHTVTVTLTNTTADSLTYTPSRVSGSSAAASTGSATHVGTTTPKYGFGEVGFTATPKTVTVLPGGTATVKIKLTAPSKVLKGKAGLLYGGWVKFTATATGNTVSVPFVGMRGDYQKVKLLNKFKLVSGSKKYSMPALGGDDGNGNVSFAPSQKSNKYAFDLDSFYPSVIYHLDYPASDLRLKVINTRTKKSYYAVINFSGSLEDMTHWNKLPRDDGARYVTFWGYVVDGSNTPTVPDGNYQLQLKVLKPLGNAAKSSDWETYTSPKFYIIT